MKKLLPIVLFTLVSTTLFAQLCTSMSSPCVSTFSRNGYFFDIEAISTVEIQGFSFMSQNPGTRDIVVYYRPGTYLGNETNASAWTLLGNFSNYTPVSATACPLPLNALTFATTVCIPQGQRYGFYFHTISGTGTIESHSTLVEGSIGAQDANMQLITGKGQFGIGPAFTGTLTAGLTFQGEIQYACSCQSVSTPESISTQQIDIHPNPATYEIKVMTGNHAGSKASIMDAMGREVIGELILSSGENTVSIQLLASGVYFVRLEDAQGMLSFHRFIKQ